MFKKNTAVTGFTVGLVSSTDGSDITTGTPVGYVTLDGGTQTAIGDTTPVHEGNGQWSFDLTAAEMNGDIVGLVFTHSSAITVHFTIKTDTKIVSDLKDFDPAADTVALVTNLTNLPSIPANWLTAAGIAASALNGKGDWNIGKTGYSLSQAFPTNFADLSITVTTGRVDINTNNDKTGYSISGTKQTLDALNDIAATSIVSGGAINTTAGAVDLVTANSDMRGTDNSFLAANAPANFSVLNITAITGLVDITQAAADKVWSTAARALTDKAGFTISGTLTTLDSLENITAAQVRTQADDALTSYDPPTNAEMQARTPTAAQLAYIVANAATGLPITFTTAGGSTTAAVLNQVDGAGASATNDQYKGRLIVFTNGTLKGVVTDITAYDGTTKVATITAIPFAPDSSHTARLI